MSVPANGNMLLAGGDDSYQISRSVRLRRNATGYLSRTFGSAGNRYTWTFSCWIKKCVITDDGNDTVLFSTTGASTYYDSIRFNNSTGTLYVYYSGGTAYASTPSNGAVFRDTSAWYHIIVAQDTTQSTEALRLRIWINGVQQTLSSIPGLNYQSGFNTASEHDIGKEYARSVYADCYMTEIRFIDGQSLSSTSFGAFDALTGVWNPIRYSGTYGTNGFYLNFSDNSGATATTIGKDYSGNGNNWTPNNILVTAGTTYDSMVDSPTNYGSDTGAGGEVRGNYATLNPIANGTAAYVKDGNLRINPSDGNFQPSLSTIGVSSGKWYAECTITAVGSGAIVGIDKLPSTLVATNYLGNSSTSYGYYGDGTNARLYNNSSFTSYGATYTTGAVIGVALDMDAGTLVFYRNGTSQGTAVTGLSGTYAIGASPAGAAGIADMNYGQRPFVYTAPSGFKALCTQNLPTPTVSNGANYMAATLYTGNGTSQSLVNTVNGISFQPDLVWTKCRSTGNNHGQIDSVRGISRWLGSSTTLAEDYTAGSYVTAFNNNGFSVGFGGVSNENGQTYVGWQWKANGSTVSNTVGSITSTVSANTAAGFSILTYTGTGATATIGHGLGAVPSMMIMKKRSAAGSWKMYHTSLGNTKIVEVNDTGAAQISSTYWNNTSPTSTLITVGSNADINASGETYVSYCWTAISGYSAFGSYVGNGVVDGPFIYCGFRPRWVMLKRTDAANHWIMYDTSRDAYNVGERWLRANTADTEATGIYWDGVSNGFKIRSTDIATNGSGGTYIYAAFAETPFTLARAR